MPDNLDISDRKKNCLFFYCMFVWFIFLSNGRSQLDHVLVWFHFFSLQIIRVDKKLLVEADTHTCM